MQLIEMCSTKVCVHGLVVHCGIVYTGMETEYTAHHLHYTRTMDNRCALRWNHISTKMVKCMIKTRLSCVLIYIMGFGG